jgi:hypothetical protein
VLQQGMTAAARQCGKPPGQHARTAGQTPTTDTCRGAAAPIHPTTAAAAAHVDDVAVQNALRRRHKRKVDQVGCGPQHVVGHERGPELLLGGRPRLHECGCVCARQGGSRTPQE